jgi:hypothetical protein
MVIRRGDHRDIYCDVTDSNGDAFSLSGHKAWFGAKEQHSLADDAAGTIFKVSTDPAEITISGNRITAHILPADTSGFAARDIKMYYEFQIYDSTGGKVYTVSSGVLTVKADVVKAVS